MPEQMSKRQTSTFVRRRSGFRVNATRILQHGQHRATGDHAIDPMTILNLRSQQVDALLALRQIQRRQTRTLLAQFRQQLLPLVIRDRQHGVGLSGVGCYGGASAVQGKVGGR